MRRIAILASIWRRWGRRHGDRLADLPQSGLACAPQLTFSSSIASSACCAELNRGSVLTEFGTTLAEDVEVRVWDGSAEVRYLVLPERPEGTQDLSENQLVKLIDRDSMIGVKKVQIS